MALASRGLPEHLRSTGRRAVNHRNRTSHATRSTLYGMLWNWFGAEHALCYLS